MKKVMMKMIIIIITEKTFTSNEKERCRDG